jgi:cytosine/adenosine deaminase-related metal-dependent hydrolase
VLPIARPPIRDGWLACERGRILDVGDGPPPDTSRVHELTACAVMPALVNAHVHLELSWMAGHVPPAPSMPVWVERLMALRRTLDREPRAPIERAIRDIRGSGTALVGDITNTLAPYEGLLDSDLSAAIFRELLGFNTPDPALAIADAAAQVAALTPVARLRPSLVPHAPYSVSPALLQGIADASVGRPISIHVAESREEVQFLRDGTGAWRDLLQRLNAWNDTWRAPGCGPVEYLERFGLVNDRLLAVHGVQFTDDELRKLAAADATVVTCPRSNLWTGAGQPPLERFYASGVRVAIGTDSLASVEDLQMFKEIAAVRGLARDIPAARILESATKSGAEALGFGEELGTIEPGKRAELLAVRLPNDVADVEEYLVGGGVEPSDIQWLRSSA